MGTSGHTSVAPKRGCSPWWARMSISSWAFFTRRKAASHTGPGSPTKVITVRLVAFPGSTSSRRTPSTVSTTAAMASIFSRSRPSLMLGTHSIIGMRNLDQGWEGDKDGRGMRNVLAEQLHLIHHAWGRVKEHDARDRLALLGSVGTRSIVPALCGADAGSP